MVIGESDAEDHVCDGDGERAPRQRYRVAVVDADLGQSEIGPPTTIGLGRVRSRLSRLGMLRCWRCISWGDVAGASLLGAVIGTRRMLDRARAAGMQRVVIDTSGLVSGHLGRTLKQANRSDGSLTSWCVWSGRGCEHMCRLRGSDTAGSDQADGSGDGAPSRSAEDRRRYREGRLNEYFASARPVALDLPNAFARPQW